MSVIGAQPDELLARYLDRISESQTSSGVISFLNKIQYRLFEQVLISVPPDGSEDLSLILAACKFLDLLLVLQTEEFQM